MTEIEELQEVIRRVHGVKSRHLKSVPVKEEFQGKTVWEGTVEVFVLKEHPEASLAYAWTHDTDDGRRRSVAVLHAPPVNSPQAAVRAAIVEEFKSRGKS